MEPIVAQGFTARVVALFYAAMRRKGYLIASSRDFFERGREPEQGREPVVVVVVAYKLI